MPQDYDVPALKRIHEILQVLHAHPAPMRAAALAERTGLSRSTLYLLLDSLERRRWIEKRGDGYIVGLALFELGSAYVRHDRLQALFRREAAGFGALYNEAVQLAVLDRDHVVYLAREDPLRPVRLVSDPGSRLPAHCCALGKALLASLDDDTLRALLPARLAPLTAQTVTRRSALLVELAEIRRSGLAIEREQVCAGLACMAVFVAVTALGKRVAISTSVPLSRLDRRQERRLAIALTEMAGRIRSRL